VGYVEKIGGRVMTLEEAKMQIQAIPEKIWDQLSEPDREAMEMAFSALQAQEEKTQLFREDTTSGVQKTCITCKHYPPESKWPCIDCDMRNPADRWEPQELSKNSPKLDKENGDLQPTCNQLATDTISRQEAIDALDCINGVEEVLRALPSAQPEIVRCKDCKFYTAYDYTGKLMCKRIGKGMILPKPEDYCSYAERIADERSD
jgi:hypothetical protein